MNGRICPEWRWRSQETWVCPGLNSWRALCCCEQGSCLMCPFVSGGGGVTPPVGHIAAHAGRLHYVLDVNWLWVLEERGSVNTGICILGAQELRSILKGLHSQSQFSSTILVTEELPSLRKSCCWLLWKETRIYLQNTKLAIGRVVTSFNIGTN